MCLSHNERTPLQSGRLTSEDDVTESGYDTHTESETEQEEENQDNNWGWFVVLGSFYCVAIVGGISYLTGIIMQSLITDLSGDITSVSLVGSLQVGITFPQFFVKVNFSASTE